MIQFIYGKPWLEDFKIITHADPTFIGNDIYNPSVIDIFLNIFPVIDIMQIGDREYKLFCDEHAETRIYHRQHYECLSSFIKAYSLDDNTTYIGIKKHRLNTLIKYLHLFFGLCP